MSNDNYASFKMIYVKNRKASCLNFLQQIILIYWCYSSSWTTGQEGSHEDTDKDH